MQVARLSKISHRIQPINNRFISRLKAPILAGALAIGGYLSANANIKQPEKDVFEPKVVMVNDTVKNNNVPADSLLLSNTKAEGGILAKMDSIARKNPLGLDASETAAEELYTNIMANISNGDENPYSAVYLGLCKARNEANDGIGSMNLDNQIQEIMESMKEYERAHRDQTMKLMQNNGSISEFYYGKDNSKKGTVFQTLSITGINEHNKNKNVNSSEQNDSIPNDDNNNNNKDFNGGLSYRMKAVTEKADVEANINASSSNVDIQLAALYRTVTDNGGYFSASLNARETLDGAETSESAGASLDYNKNKFSTGAYYYYNHDVDESGDDDKTNNLNAYLMYKQNVKLNAGYEESDGASYYYSSLKLFGTKDFSNSNLRLNGSLIGEAGPVRLHAGGSDDDAQKMMNYVISATGGISFQSDDITASLNARIMYNYLDYPYFNSHYDDFNISVLGAFSKGKVAVSAMISKYQELYSTAEKLADDDIDSVDSNSISTSVSFEIKDLLKGISPQFSYTSMSINNTVQHFFNVTLKTSIESLRKNLQ